jgi:hypothetical protein
MTRTPGKRIACLLGACGLLAGGAGTVVLLSTASAGAVACGNATAAGTPCTMTGTLVLSSGALTLTAPNSLSWAGNVTGLDQKLVDMTAADETYLVDDATGTGAGWHVTVSATTFTSGAQALPNAGTFTSNGSVTSVTDATPPTTACSTGSTCTLPTNTTTYPVAITTAATAPAAVNIYDTSAGTGKGSIIIGGSTANNPVGWWLNVPSNTLAGTYTSTVTMEIISGP